jgi:hypothetical protein
LFSIWRGGGVCECSKVWGFSLVADKLLVSQVGLYFMEMVYGRSKEVMMYVTGNLVYALC